MKNISKSYLRSYEAWEQENEEELYELFEKLQKFISKIKKYSNVSLYFLNLLSKKIAVYSYLFLKVLLIKPSLIKHISPEQIPEDVLENHRPEFYF